MATIITGDEDGVVTDDNLTSGSNGDVIYGLYGDDTLTAAHDGVTLYGGSGIDVLESQKSADNTTDNTTMDGGPGDDELIGWGTNDTASYANDPASYANDPDGVRVDLSAGEATDGYGDTDSLLWIENITGSAFADTLIGDKFANVLQGGAGDDTLTGNGGADVFKFSFDLQPGSGGGDTPLSFDAWLNTDGLTITNLRQNEFVQNYKEWLGYLADELKDIDGFNTIPENAKVSFKQNDSGATPKIEGLTQTQLDQIFGDVRAISVNTGKTSQVRYYSDIDRDSGIWGDGGVDTVTSGDGFDTIVDFGNGADKVRFDFSAATNWDASFTDNATKLGFLEGFFSISQVDVFSISQVDVFGNFDPTTGAPVPDGTNDSTRISLMDNSWSTTLEGKLLDTPVVLVGLDIYVNDILIG